MNQTSLLWEKRIFEKHLKHACISNIKNESFFPEKHVVVFFDHRICLLFFFFFWPLFLLAYWMLCASWSVVSKDGCCTTTRMKVKVENLSYSWLGCLYCLYCQIYIKFLKESRKTTQCKEAHYDYRHYPLYQFIACTGS